MKSLLNLLCNVIIICQASMNPSLWRETIVKPMKEMVKSINIERSLIAVNNTEISEYYPGKKLLDIFPDFLTQDHLQQYVGLGNDLTQNSSRYVSGDYVRYDLGFFLMRLPNFRYERILGYRYLFRHKLENKLSSILKKQRNCYNIHLCDKLSFSEFKSCIKPLRECNSVFLIYPRIFKASQSSIAFVDSGGYRYYYIRQAYDFTEDYPFMTI